MDIDSLDISSLTPEVLQMLAHMPAGAPPEGVVPNFENPPTRAAIQIWSTSVCLVLALLFFFNRLYIKARWMKKWSWDDCMLMPLLPHSLDFQSNTVSSDLVVIGGMPSICPLQRAWTLMN
jgi:hypothetical protein